MSDNDALSHLYRQLPAEQPSTRLDAKVLAAVNTELATARQQRARSQRRWRYQVPLATAATVVLAMALFLRQTETQQELRSPGSEDSIARYSVLAHEAGSDIATDQDPSSGAHELRKLIPPPPPMSVPPPVPAPPMVAMMDLPAPVSAPTIAPEPTTAAAAAPMATTEPPPARAQVPNMAAIAPMGIIADRALPKMQLGALLNEAAGMPAKEFCTGLLKLWPALETAPACPISDGQHEWPEPLPVAWRVNAGHVQSAELRR